MNTIERHTLAYESKTIQRLDADFWLYRTLWVEIGPLRATWVFWCVRVWGGWMYGKRRTSNKPGERICEPSAGSKYAPADGSTGDVR